MAQILDRPLGAIDTNNIQGSIKEIANYLEYMRQSLEQYGNITSKRLETLEKE